MPVALPALELGAWLIFAVALVLAMTVRVWLGGLFYVIDKATSWIPFAGGWIRSGENYVLRQLNGLIAASRGAMTTCLQGIRWSVLEVVQGVRDAYDFLGSRWHQLVVVALPLALQRLYADAWGAAHAVDQRVDALGNTVDRNLAAARNFATTEAGLARTKAEDYADSAISAVHDTINTHISGVYKEVEADIVTARRVAQDYADTAVGALKTAEDAAIGAARTAAATALAAAVSELRTAIGAVRTALTTAETTLTREIGAVATGAAAALSSATTALERELATAEQAAAADLAATAGTLTAAITSGVQAAETAASTALAATAGELTQTIADARTAAETALGAASRTIEADISAAATAAAAELHTTATALQTAIGAVESTAQATVAELTAAEHAAAGELADIYNLPTDRIKELLDRLDLTKVIGFGAGLVLVKALVEAIAVESGLDDPACRAKHKQVCGVDPFEWAGLLGGAAFLTGALSLREIVPVARGTMHELESLIRQAV